jgi:hypothetical protein
MDTGVPWSIIGPLATLVGALIGIGVGWGSMKSIVASLKVEVVNFREIASQITQKVTTLETHNAHSQRSIEDLTRRVGELEIDVSALKAASPRSRRR